MSELPTQSAMDDTSQKVEHGGANARASITETGLRYFATFATVTLFLMVGLAFVCGVSWSRAEAAKTASETAAMEARVAQDEITRLRIEVAKAEGRHEAQPKGR